MSGGASVADRIAIRDVVDRFNIGVMRKDAAIWGSAWADEGRWDIDLLDKPAEGRAVLLSVFQTIMDRIEFASMTSAITDIVVTGDRASIKCYNQEILYTADGPPKILVGCFHDQLVRRGEEWVFQERKYEALKRGPLLP